MKQPDALWGPPEITSWRNTPHTTGRIATESDVKLGRAVFFTARKDGSPSEARVHSMPIPSCAILYPEPPESSPVPVLIIQAEEVDGKVLIGYRPATGGNGICILAEVELLPGPDQRFGQPASTKAGV